MEYRDLFKKIKTGVAPIVVASVIGTSFPSNTNASTVRLYEAGRKPSPIVYYVSRKNYGSLLEEYMDENSDGFFYCRENGKTIKENFKSLSDLERKVKYYIDSNGRINIFYENKDKKDSLKIQKSIPKESFPLDGFDKKDNKRDNNKLHKEYLISFGGKNPSIVNCNGNNSHVIDTKGLNMDKKWREFIPSKYSRYNDSYSGTILKGLEYFLDENNNQLSSELKISYGVEDLGYNGNLKDLIEKYGIPNNLVGKTSCLGNENCSNLTKDEILISSENYGTITALVNKAIENVNKGKYSFSYLNSLTEKYNTSQYNNKFVKILGYVLPFNYANESGDHFTGLKLSGNLNDKFKVINDKCSKFSNPTEIFECGSNSAYKIINDELSNGGSRK